MVLLIGGIAALLEFPFIGPFMILFALIIFTGYRGIQFKREGNLYRSYFSFILLKFGMWKEYESIEMIYVNSSKTSQKVYTMVTDGITLRDMEYNGYLLFSNGAKEFLASSKDKNKLFAKLNPLIEFTHLDIVDNTE